jgi:hypothetical protein
MHVYNFIKHCIDERSIIKKIFLSNFDNYFYLKIIFLLSLRDFPYICRIFILIFTFKKNKKFYLINYLIIILKKILF